MRGLAATIVVLGACGRVGFDGVVPGDGASDGSGCAFDLCDDFEGATLAPIWTPDNAVAIDTAFAHGGNRSVHFHTDAVPAHTTNYTVITETATFATPPAQIWVRAWFRIAQLPVGNNSMELVTAQNAMANSVGDYVFISQNATSILAEVSNQETRAASAVPTDTWFCVVFHVLVTPSTNGQLDLGSPIMISLPNVTTDPSPPLANVAIGLGWGATNVLADQPTTELWADDVIIHHAPLTCAD